MPITIDERVSSREATESDDPNTEILYVVQGTDDDAVVKALVAATAPAFYDGLRRDSFTISTAGGGVWECAVRYLADDDHGPLALQEILLAGCPTVGVRTGAAFVEHGLTGYFVDRLPPGRQCVASANDEAALVAYVDALRQAQALDRRAVRDHAVDAFRTERIADAVISALDTVRFCAANQ